MTETPSDAEVTNVYDGSAESSMCRAPARPDGVRLISGFVRAVKPASSGCCGDVRCC
jgi:hypothetical protein